ncbi:MAG: hypothetical protein H7X91_00110 [Burkholderiales bacterium]|nr:hypothetical protein [Burkholderiales bacterium]
MSARESQELLVVPAPNESAAPSRTQIDGVVVGTLVGFLENAVPLVVYPGQPGSAAIAARAILDLRGEHIGREVVLMFEGSDPLKPLVVGCLQEKSAWPLAEKPAQVEVDADGERLVIDAKNEIVLRCGKASITLTKAGKVLIRGAYLLSRSSGVNRIKGGSVQIN